MKLESLHIYATWGGDRYQGSIKFAGDRGSVEVKLTTEVSDQLLQVIADALVESSKALARNLTAACIEARTKPSLPPAPDEEGL